MNKSIDKYLPLGSVVLLKNGKKKLMINGYGCKSSNPKKEFCDYVGCLWPEGIISTDRNFAFNHDDIEKIYAVGYSDEEGKKFINLFSIAVSLREKRLKKISDNSNV